MTAYPATAARLHLPNYMIASRCRSLRRKSGGDTKLAEAEAATAKEKGGFGWFLRDIRRVIEYPVKGQLGIYNLIYTKGVIIPYPRSLKNPTVK